MKILIIGDSQTDGAPGRAVESKMRDLGHETRRIGHVGHGAYDWSRMHWAEYLAALRSFVPDMVLLIFGSNDPASTNLRAAMERFKASHPKVYYAGPPRYDAKPDVQAIGSRVRDLAMEVFGDRYLDAYPYTGSSVPRAADHVHFGPTGGAMWADGIIREWTTPPSAITRTARSLSRWRGPLLVLGSAAFVYGVWLWSERSRT